MESYFGEGGDWDFYVLLSERVCFVWDGNGNTSSKRKDVVMRGEGVLYVVDGGGCENMRIVTIRVKARNHSTPYTHLPFNLLKGTSTSTSLQAQFLISPRSTSHAPSLSLFPTIHHSTSYSPVPLSHPPRTPSEWLSKTQDGVPLRRLSQVSEAE